MKLAIIGTTRRRRDLREALDVSAIEVVGEFESRAEARRAGIQVDAFLHAAVDPAPDRAPFAEELTPREIEVLERLAEGLANKAIALRLGISDQTVKFHIASIIGKLGATNRTHAVRLAVRRGLIAL